MEDSLHFWKRTRGEYRKSKFGMFWTLLISMPEFRSVFYARLGFWGRAISFLMKPQNNLCLNAKFVKDYDGGLYVAHGYCTRIGAERIGKNLWIHQNVTIGLKGEGRPKIGNNVYIGTGAVIIGDVTIGDNARIGANATVVDDVPENAVVVSPKATVVKYICTGGGAIILKFLNVA